VITAWIAICSFEQTVKIQETSKLASSFAYRFFRNYIFLIVLESLSESVIQSKAKEIEYKLFLIRKQEILMIYINHRARNSNFRKS